MQSAWLVKPCQHRTYTLSHWVSVVRRQQFFKHQLLLNRWANLDQTWQECSLGGPLKKVFTEFDSVKNSGCHGNQMEFFSKFCKNLLL